jgi:glutamyl-tRNA(Gln) amidotransferase subunit D
MLYSYPGMNPDILDSMVDRGYHGIVIIGTGLGHVGTDMFPALERCQEEEIPVVLVVEPLFGYIHLRVYETGRDMLARGVIEGGNMLPSAAYTKLIWVLGHTQNLEEVKTLMQTDIAGEITQREGPRGFLLLQGVEQGTDELLKRL